MLVVKSSLHTVNKTIRELYANQKSLQEGIETLISVTNDNTNKLSSTLSKQELMIRVNEHINTLNLEIESLRVQYESLLNAIIKQIIRYFNTFQVDQVQEVSLPIPEGGDSEIKLMLPISSIPEDCEAHIVKLVDTLWLQLDNNEWLYVASNAEKITTVCENNEPFDIILKGT
ncbi:hypothetical protein PR048_012772, partial [Dryococelus australis]